MPTAVYRAYLRAVRRLPVRYLRQSFAVRARTDLDAVVDTPEPALRSRKLADVARRLRRLQRATEGDYKAFNHILELAYGRTGKLRWELLFPVRTDPTANPAPIIRGVSSSAPAPYSPELRTLLTTSLPDTKPLTPADLKKPRTLPPRADPTSEEAVLRGPFSKRREVNIRHRAHTAALRRVSPPLELAVRPTPDEPAFVPGPSALAAFRADDAAVYPRPLAMQGLGLMRDIEELIGGTIHHTPQLTKRERRTAKISPAAPDAPAAPDTTTAAPRHPQRWVRRRYRLLLTQLPQLTYDATSARYSACISPLAINFDFRASHYNPPIDPVGLAWLQSAPEETPAKKSKRPLAAPSPRSDAPGSHTPSPRTSTPPSPLTTTSEQSKRGTSNV